MYHAKAMIKPSLKVVEISSINFATQSLWYVDGEYIEPAKFEDIVWLECNSRPLTK